MGGVEAVDDRVEFEDVGGGGGVEVEADQQAERFPGDGGGVDLRGVEGGVGKIVGVEDSCGAEAAHDIGHVGIVNGRVLVGEDQVSHD